MWLQWIWVAVTFFARFRTDMRIFWHSRENDVLINSKSLQHIQSSKAQGGIGIVSDVLSSNKPHCPILLLNWQRISIIFPITKKLESKIQNCNPNSQKQIFDSFFEFYAKNKPNVQKFVWLGDVSISIHQIYVMRPVALLLEVAWKWRFLQHVVLPLMEGVNGVGIWKFGI